MRNKKRILFSFETADEWIFQAYKGFYDSLPKDRYEVFCTADGIGDHTDVVGEYNVIDYKKIPHDGLILLAKSLVSHQSEALLEEAQRSALWGPPQQLLERFAGFKVVLSLLQPDMVVVWNGMGDIRRMIRLFLSELHIPLFYAEKGMLPNSWYLDEAGINARCSLDASSVNRKLDLADKRRVEAYIRNNINSGSSAWEQPARINGDQAIRRTFGIDADSPVIFFPGQVDEDVNITAFSPFRNVAEAVRCVLQAIPEKVVLAVKPHPKSKKASQEKLAQLAHRHRNLFLVEDVNVWDMIEISDMVVVINSTVAFESLLNRKKTLLLGDSVLSGAGLVEKVEVEDLPTKIRTALNAHFESLVDYSKVLSFVKFLLDDYYIFRDSPALPAAILQRLNAKIKTVSGKVFSRNQIMQMLCESQVSVSCPDRDVSDESHALADFLKAREEFDKRNFSKAVEHMQKYRTTVDYSLLPRTLKTAQKANGIDVSVIIVTYNRTEDLKKCLESLSNQDDTDFEVIVVDNSGTDFNSVKPYIDQYIKCPVNFNLSEGRNIGACCAKGRIVAFLDDDALVPTNYISSIKAAFETYDIYGLRGKALPKTDPDANKDAAGYDRGPNPFPTFCDLEGNSAFLRKIYLSMDGMDPLLFGHEGSDLTYRIAKKFNATNKVIYWPYTVIYHDNVTGAVQEQKKDRYRLIEQYLPFKHNSNIFALRPTVERSYLPPRPQPKQSTPTLTTAPLSFDSDNTPVVVIAYNRPKHTLEVLKALKHHGIKNIYIFSDAPKTDAEQQSVSLVRRLARSIDWTTPKIIERTENFGLARSIVTAVDHVFERYDKLILLEDDCVPQQYFFDFIQTCLQKYEHNPKVFGISGHSVPVPEQLRDDYPCDLYFCPRIGSWGWATWKRAWQHYDRDLKKLVELANSKNIDLTQGGTDIPVSIENFLKGRLKDVWTLNWVLSVYLNNGLYIYPTRSHISNIGTDGTGLHCGKTDKYDSPSCDTRPTRYPDDVAIDQRILENFKSYFQADPLQSRNAVTFLRPLTRKSPLKIAQISTADKRGGAAKVAWMLKQGLKKKGIRSEMFVKVKSSEDNDVHIITNPALDSGDLHRKKGLLYYDIKSTFQLARNENFTSADILHFHNLHGDYFNPFALAELTKIKPSVWTLHDMQSITGHCAHALDCDKWLSGCGNCPDLRTYPAVPSDQTARMWEDKRKIYRQSDIELIVPSQWLKGIVEKSILRDKNINLIYNGIDANIYQPYDKRQVRQKLNIPENAMVLGFVSHKGLLDARKGGDFVLQAYRYFAAKYPNLYFLCIGGQAPNAPTERFLQIPFVTDETTLAQLYCAADVFVFPTLADNCPLIVLELMGCGVPVVSFSVGGVPELIENGKTGFVAPSKNANELVRMTEILTTDSDMRQRFGRAASERLRSLFTLDKMLDKHVRLYEQLVETAHTKKHASSANTVAVPSPAGPTETDYLVSAIVSTYNAEEFVRGCLEDLENQTIADRLEIIVVNSNSQQNEDAIVKEFRKKYDNITYIKTEQRENLYTAWNRAVKIARGRFLTNANTDDRHRKDALEILANALLENPDVALVYSDQVITDTPNPTFENHHVIQTAKRPEYSHKRLLFGCCVGSQPMWRKKLHDELGCFDDTLDSAADWEFWLRISEKYPCKRVPQFLGLYFHNAEGIEHGRKIHSLYERYLVGKRYGNPYISVIPVYTTRDNPLVSVITPACNAQDHIAEAVESVLIQNYRNFELVIVDDGSTDRTADIIAGFKDDRIRYFYQENKGVSSARNLAIRRAKGRLLMPLDADDMMVPNFIALHLEAFEKNPDVDLVYSDVLLIDADSKPIKAMEKPQYHDRRHLIRDLFRCGHSVVPFRLGIRKDVFDKIGLYDESLLVAEDYDMMRRFVKHGLKMYHLKGTLHLRRMTGNSLSGKFAPPKARSHFDVVRRFTETFSPEELFPDVDWNTIGPDQKPLLAKCRAAIAYLALANEYVKTNAPRYAAIAFEYADNELTECLEIDPGNRHVQKLIEKCDRLRAAFGDLAGQPLCQPA